MVTADKSVHFRDAYGTEAFAQQIGDRWKVQVVSKGYRLAHTYVPNIAVAFTWLRGYGYFWQEV